MINTSLISGVKMHVRMIGGVNTNSVNGQHLSHFRCQGACQIDGSVNFNSANGQHLSHFRCQGACQGDWWCEHQQC